MIPIRQFCITGSIRTLQAVEKALEFLFHARPFIPFGVISLAAGFIIGYLLTK